jgi:hypothetical protein
MVVGGVGVEVQGGEKMRRSIRGWEKEKVKPAGQGQRNGKGRGQRAEGRGQRAEGRGQRAEGRGQRAEGRGQRAEIREQRIHAAACAVCAVVGEEGTWIL